MGGGRLGINFQPARSYSARINCPTPLPTMIMSVFACSRQSVTYISLMIKEHTMQFFVVLKSFPKLHA